MYRLVQKKGTVLISTSLVWPVVAGCRWAETFSQLSSISFPQPCNVVVMQRMPWGDRSIVENMQITFGPINTNIADEMMRGYLNLTKTC